MQENILVSACLLGVDCRYDGTSTVIEQLKTLKMQHNLIPICPEIFGGMQTPRAPAERINNKVVTITGEDVTSYYTKGAEQVLQLAKFYDCRYAILKEHSPSCGYEKIYDGTFSGKLIAGSGVLAELLAANGITIVGETKITQLFSHK